MNAHGAIAKRHVLNISRQIQSVRSAVVRQRNSNIGAVKACRVLLCSPERNVVLKVQSLVLSPSRFNDES